MSELLSPAVKRFKSAENSEVQQTVRDNITSPGENDFGSEPRILQRSLSSQEDNRSSVTIASAEVRKFFVKYAIDMDGTVALLLSKHPHIISNSQSDKDQGASVIPVDCTNSVLIGSTGFIASSVGYQATPQLATEDCFGTFHKLPHGNFCYVLRGGGPTGGQDEILTKIFANLAVNSDCQLPLSVDMADDDDGSDSSLSPNEHDPFGIPRTQKGIHAVYWRREIANLTVDRAKALTKIHGTELLNEAIENDVLKQQMKQFANVIEKSENNTMKVSDYISFESEFAQLLCRTLDRKSCIIWAALIMSNAPRQEVDQIPVTNANFTTLVKEHLTENMALLVGLHCHGNHYFIITGYGDEINITQSWEKEYAMRNETHTASEFFQYMDEILCARHETVQSKLFKPPKDSRFLRPFKIDDVMWKFEVGIPLVKGRGIGQTPTGLRRTPVEPEYLSNIRHSTK